MLVLGLTILASGIIMLAMGTYADALFTKTQQRVLAVLFGQPERSFYANEVIRLAQSGSGTVQRELARLEAAKLITMHPIGNQKHYQANPSTLIFDELRAIVQKTFGIADVLRTALEPFWPQIEFALLDDSPASGKQAGSDLDLMLIGAAPHTELLTAFLPVQAKLGRPVNLTLYTVDEFAQRVHDEPSFIQQVLEQPAIFVKGSKHDLSRLGGEPDPDRHAEDETA
jgi:hypothetical protein